MKEEIKEDYTRITTIASAFVDFKSIPPDVLNNASERGTRVHAACDAIIAGDDFGIYPDSDAGYVESFKKWYVGKEFLPKVPRLYSETLKITGEIDLVYKCPKRGNILVDLKTSGKESKSWEVQGGGYVHLMMLNCSSIRFIVDGIEFIKLDKDGKPPKVFEYKLSVGLFLSCYEAWNHYYKDQETIEISDYL